MDDLTTELGFQDFLAERYAEVERAICARYRDRFHAEEAVANGFIAVWEAYKEGKLNLVPVDIVAYWKTRSRWEITKIRKRHNRAIYGTPYEDYSDGDVYSGSYIQPLSCRKHCVAELLSESVLEVLEKKENGQAAAKQLSALNLFASNNEEYLAVLTALTEMIHANESTSDDGTIKINWSELARQSNSILDRKRFDDRSVKTCFNKFSRHASAYLRDSVA